MLCEKSFEYVSINKLLGKVNGNGKQQSLFDYILLALKQLQGLHFSLQIPKYEDSRNSFVANVLTNKNFRVKDQTQFGKSTNGKRGLGVKAGLLLAKKGPPDRRPGQNIGWRVIILTIGHFY